MGVTLAMTNPVCRHYLLFPGMSAHRQHLARLHIDAVSFEVGTAVTLEPLERTLMSAKLYIGNLPYSLTEDELRKIFEGVGEVVSARIALDRETRRPRGFGFVEMASAELAQDAVSRLNQSMVSGRAIIVNEARPQENRPRPEGRRTGGYDRPRSY